MSDVDSVRDVVTTSKDEKKIISRLIMQKIMSSSAVKYLNPPCFEAVSAALLSDDPDKDINLVFKTVENRSSYYSSIVDLSVKWEQGKDEIVDSEGNAWTT